MFKKFLLVPGAVVALVAATGASATASSLGDVTSAFSIVDIVGGIFAIGALLMGVMVAWIGVKTVLAAGKKGTG